MKIDYENLKPADLTGEEIRFKIDRGAISATLNCPRCSIKMKKVVVDMDIPDEPVTLHIEGFRCRKCGKEVLNLKQAEKLDELLIFIDALKHKSKFKFERAANFDGKNWFIRFPNDVTKSWERGIIADIVPVSNHDYFIHIKKSK